MSLELLARRWGSYAERLVLDRKGSYAEHLTPLELLDRRWTSPPLPRPMLLP